MTSGLHERYRSDVVPALQKQFEYSNPMEVPRLTKIVVNIGLGEALQHPLGIPRGVISTFSVGKK